MVDTSILPFHLKTNNLNCAGATQWNLRVNNVVNTPPKQLKENIPIPPPNGPSPEVISSKTTVLSPIKPIATEAHTAVSSSSEEASTCYICEKNSDDESVLLCDGQSEDGGECNREAHFW